MLAFVEEESKLTERYQTTIPSGVRKQLRLGKGDRIRYRIASDGRVYIEAAQDENGDPALAAFLDFIEADLKAHPEKIQALDGALHDRLTRLVGHVDVDLNEALSEDDE